MVLPFLDFPRLCALPILAKAGRVLLIHDRPIGDDHRVDPEISAKLQLVVVIGNKKAGKTTLANAIALQANELPHRFPFGKTDEIEEQQDLCILNAMRTIARGQLAVIDAAEVSYKLQALLMLLSSRTLVVRLSCSKATWARRWMRTPNRMRSPKLTAPPTTEYIKSVRRHHSFAMNIPQIALDTNTHSPQQCLAKTLAHIDALSRPAKTISNNPTTRRGPGTRKPRNRSRFSKRAANARNAHTATGDQQTLAH